eukprot:GHVR01171779.1.p1 GENE.GHVR01171779.1~~GHVR01171779.1.p1  ORF type:complete len:457 (-),score=90.11 GHVR01171779.1:160-1530(-)
MVLRICMVSDFFYPGLGGVEMHIYQLSQCLILKGYKVIVITHSRGNCYGIKYLTNGLKVYYLPYLDFVENCTLPTAYTTFPLVRNILIRERVDIVHGHQATSNLAHETITHAGTMGIKLLYTDHSCFGFSDTGAIHINKLLKFFLTDVDHAICVSHTNKENLSLRTGLDPLSIYVIPNAVDSERFIPDVSKRNNIYRNINNINNINNNINNNNIINIIVMCRLTYRKGIDLVIDLIPIICNKHSNVNFIIGGDGPKRVLIEEMREKYMLYDRVEILGAVPHNEVCGVLQRGHIFMNCSLTEAFCIAIVEAASCGLFVVATNVGGVSEVLPPDIVRLTEATTDSLVEAISESVIMLQNKEINTKEIHDRVAKMYCWRDVATRTEHVYKNIMKTPCRPVLSRFSRIYNCGPIAGKLYCIVIILDYLLYLLLEFIYPRKDVDIVPDFPYVPHRDTTTIT